MLKDRLAFIPTTQSDSLLALAARYKLLGGNARLGGLVLDLLAVLVGAGEEH